MPTPETRSHEFYTEIVTVLQKIQVSVDALTKAVEGRKEIDLQPLVDALGGGGIAAPKPTATPRRKTAAKKGS